MPGPLCRAFFCLKSYKAITVSGFTMVLEPLYHITTPLSSIVTSHLLVFFHYFYSKRTPFAYAG